MMIYDSDNTNSGEAVVQRQIFIFGWDTRPGVILIFREPRSMGIKLLAIKSEWYHSVSHRLIIMIKNKKCQKLTPQHYEKFLLITSLCRFHQGYICMILFDYRSKILMKYSIKEQPKFKSVLYYLLEGDRLYYMYEFYSVNIIVYLNLSKSTIPVIESASATPLRQLLYHFFYPEEIIIFRKQFLPIIFHQNQHIVYSNSKYRMMNEKNQKKPKKKGGSKKKKMQALIQTEQLAVEHVVYQKFLKFMDHKRVSLLREKLTQFFGKNFPINYRSLYNFEQQWEGQMYQQKQQIIHYIYQENRFQLFLSLVTIFIFALLVWFSNVDFFFTQKTNTENTKETIYGLGIIAIILDSFLKMWKVYLTGEKQLRILSNNYMSIISIIYLILKVFTVPARQDFSWVLVQILITLNIYNKLRNNYGSLRLISFSLNIEYQAKITDMILTLITILHIVAVALMCSTYAGYEETWLSSIQFDSTNQYLLYLYSFYFGCTTVLTVGYGDIAAKNPFEVFVIIMVEIFGIVMFAYIINQIGYSISNLRKGREIVEKDLSTMQKIKKYYKMQKHTLNRARNFIITHKPTFQYLDPNEQSKLMMKFNQDLRHDITQQNHLSIIKSSIFFLIRWSKSFQQAASLKLSHILFYPNELIYQTEGKQRIYIFRTGKVNIYAERNGHKKGLNNLLKMIHGGLEKQVFDNCYGYTAVISTKATHLYAYARKFTSAYFLDKKSFMQSIAERIDDFEYFHEIRSRMDQSQNSQALQIPTLESSRHHFNPTKTVIIRKYSRQSNILIQFRSSYSRNSKRKHYSKSSNIIYHQNSTLVRQIKNQIQQQQLSRLEFEVDDDLISAHNSIIEDNKSSLSHDSTTNNRKSIIKVCSSFNFESYCKFDQLKGYFDHFFQQGKQYANFFFKSNKSEVIRKLERENSLFEAFCEESNVNTKQAEPQHQKQLHNNSNNILSVKHNQLDLTN